MSTNRPTRTTTLALGLALIVAALLALTPGASAQTQERPVFTALKPELQTLVIAWLNRDCSADDGLALEDRLVAASRALEPAFVEAFQLGRPAREIASDRAAIAERYRRRQDWLRKSGAELFGQKETESLLAVSEAEYVADELRGIEVGYRTQAVLGLGWAGGEETRALLERVAADDDDPARDAARQALETRTKGAPG